MRCKHKFACVNITRIFNLNICTNDILNRREVVREL